MSIEITYPSPDKMRIQCGADVVEVLLHAGMTSQAPVPAPAPAADPVPASPPITEPEPEVRPSIGSFPGGRPTFPWPKPPPGVMGIIMIGTPRGPGRVWPLLKHWNFDLGEPSLKIADLQSSTLIELRARVRAMRERAGVIAMQPMVLDVEVRPNRTAPAIDVAELNTLVEEPSLGLEGIRLVFLPEDGLL